MKWDPLDHQAQQETKDNKANPAKKDHLVLKEELDNRDLQDLRVLKETRYFVKNYLIKLISFINPC